MASFLVENVICRFVLFTSLIHSKIYLLYTPNTGMASLTLWTWVSVNSGSWWWTGRPGVLGFMGSQRVGHDWATDLIWSDASFIPSLLRVLIIKECWILSIFLISVEMIICSLLVWHMKLIDLRLLNHLSIPGIYPIWSWCMILLIYHETGLLIFCWGFLHVC